MPARHEARRIPALLAALAVQRAAPPFALTLLVDGPGDAGRDAALGLAQGLPYRVRVADRAADGAGNAGIARGAACTLAIAGADDEAVLLTTDADSVPAPGWIAANVAGLAAADIVAGAIRRRAGTSRVADRMERYLDRLHGLRRAIDPVPWEAPASHHWASAASLAMRAGTYRAVGGFPGIARGEDAALADRAARLGLRLRRDAAVVVRTSARRQGRAADGFAAELRRMDAAGAMPVVAHPEDEAWRYRMHAAVRGGAPGPALAAALGIAADDLARVLAEVPNGEALAARIVGAPPGGMRRVPLSLAEAVLAGMTDGAVGAAA